MWRRCRQLAARPPPIPAVAHGEEPCGLAAFGSRLDLDLELSANEYRRALTFRKGPIDSTETMEERAVLHTFVNGTEVKTTDFEPEWTLLEFLRGNAMCSTCAHAPAHALG